MANLNVSYGDIESAASKLTSGEQSLQETLSSLKSLIDSLVESGFVTDKASVQFQTSYTEFNDGATKTINGLTGLSGFLTKATQSMQELDQSLASAAGQ